MESQRGQTWCILGLAGLIERRKQRNEYNLMPNQTLLNGDCLELMAQIPDGSVDMILCDLPYGTTACKWDNIIEFEPLWGQYKRVIKQHGAIVLFGVEPFSSRLRVSNLDWFKYDWYWHKPRPSGFTNAKLKPLNEVESISVFSSGSTANCSERNMPYFPQGLIKSDKLHKRPNRYHGTDEGLSFYRENNKLERVIEFEGYPRQVLRYPNPNNSLLHPTQKPVVLCEYLIRTYTNENETVLDNCMGSGTTGIACINTKRNFIGIEKDQKYFEIAQNRIAEKNYSSKFIQY